MSVKTSKMDGLRSHQSLAHLPFLFVGLLLSCGGEGGRPDTLHVEYDTVRGIPLTANRGEPPTWSLDTLLTLGGLHATEQPQQFGRIASVAADHNGNLFILDVIRDEVLVFSPSGEYLRMVGQQGPGPGEYQNPNHLGLLGDTLVVADATDLRVGLFKLDGEWLGEWPTIANLAGIVQAGHEQIWLRTVQWDGSSEPVSIFEGHGIDGWVDTVLASPDPNRDLMEPSNTVVCRSPQRISGLTVPFAPKTVRIPTPRREILESDPVGYRMVFTTFEGDTTHVVEYQTPDTLVSDLEWQEQEEEWGRFRADGPGLVCDGRLTRPARKRLIDDVVFDDQGRIWIERVQLDSSDEERFDVFSPDGELLGMVVTPTRARSARPFVRGDRIYLVTADSLDVQSVHVLQFSPEAGT
jgi:hypothetical protein